jgi:hypothetical protein
MSMINIELPASLLLSTGQSQEEFVREAKFLLALAYRPGAPPSYAA